MNIEELKALSEQEINMMCAIYVMGFKHRGYCEDMPERPYVSPNPQGKLVLYKDDGYAFWNPTEDMNDAMLLVESRSDCLHLKQHGKEGTWESMFCGSGYDAVSADTASLAICYSALLGLE